MGRNVQIKDIHLAAYIELQGIEAHFTMVGTRVLFEFPNDDITAKFMAEFQCNPAIPILDYVNTLRRLRSRMLAAPDSVDWNKTNKMNEEQRSQYATFNLR